MSLDLVIRPADRADLPAVLALYAQPDFDAGQVLDLPAAERLFERFAAYPDYVLYVALQDNAVVGTFALLVMDNLGHRGTPSAVMEDVVVAQAAQGSGVGKAMVAQAITLCRDKGCYKLALSSNLRREGAHAFYEALGFERHGYSYRILL